jgi:transposase
MQPKVNNLKAAMEMFLDLPDTEIQEVIEDRDGHYIVTVISTKKEGTCHKCGKRIDKAYGYGEWILLRHLPIFGKEVYIRIRLPRYQCTRCDGNPTTTQTLSWFERRSSSTKAFEERILLSCINSTITDVARKEGISCEAVQGILDRQIAKEVNWDTIHRLDVIGIDEISLKKGHQDFVVIVSARVDDEIRLLGVLEDRTKQKVKEFFLSIPKRLRRVVHYICTDMYDGFINAAKEVFGSKVRIVADRFHVAKLYRDGFEKLRLQELRRLKKELTPTKYMELKGAMWALRKKPTDLTEEEQKMLARLFTHSPLLKQAYAFRDELTDLFNKDLAKAQAKRRLNGWIARVKRSSVRCFDSFTKTLKVRFDEITNYFVERHTSGFVEGLNNKVKVIKRRCYGILNPGHLFQRISLDLFGYASYA